MIIDMLHSNAVLKAFVHILNETKKKRQKEIEKISMSASITEDEAEKGYEELQIEENWRKRARIRWFVAYTLIHNEDLRLQRAHTKRFTFDSKILN